MALLSRRKGRLKPSPLARSGAPLLILGNGPSLRRAIDNSLPRLIEGPAMAVNFAANAPEFFKIKPAFYIFIDPHFFCPDGADPNVDALRQAFARVDWPLSLIIPARRRSPIPPNPFIKVLHINDIGIDAPDFLMHRALRSGRAMPRPRNVLIPAIAAAMALGFKDIRLLGADHSWLRSLDIDDKNRVVSVQPHFYADNEAERARQAVVYADVTLPEILDSFRIAFLSYHRLQSYAAANNVAIINETPRSMIDAFPRR